MQLRSSFKSAGLGGDMSCGLGEFGPIADLALNAKSGDILAATQARGQELSGMTKDY